ncbi:MAG: hypothetical protein J6W51_07160 [Fibrobacter sp.]|nr:hypothetical protein [Fibrobacter sp.]
MPEYEMGGNQCTHLVLKNSQKKDLSKKYLTAIEAVYDFFRFENVKLKYCMQNVVAFLFPYKKNNNYYPSWVGSIQQSLKKWDEIPTNHFKTFFSKEACPQIICLILNHDAFNCKNLPFDSSPLDIKSIFSWLVKKRNIHRLYGGNIKHGENGKGKKTNKDEDVSSLECTEEEAKKMLYEAIMRSETHLFALDCTRKKIIAFRSQDHGKTFHGFHINNLQQRGCPSGKIFERLCMLHPDCKSILKKYKP